MDSYSQKFLTKFKLFLLVILIVTTAATIALNIILAKSKSTITQLINKQSPREVSIGAIFYLPPNFIFLKNVSILETTPAAEKALIFMPTILAKISFLELIIKKHLFISDIYLYKPKTDYAKFYSFLKDNFVQIMDFMRSLPRQDIKFAIEGARLDLAKKDFSSNYILADFALNIKGDSVSGSGSVGKYREMPLQFSFRGFLTKDEFSIENLELRGENLYSRLWGGTNGNILRLNGSAFINTLFKDSGYQEPRVSSEVFYLPQANLHIFDIDCLVNLTYPRLQIQNLSFSLNNAPVKLKGNISFSDPISLYLIFSSYPAHLKNCRIENLKKMDLRIKGTLQNKTFNGNGILNLAFTRKKKSEPPLKTVELGFKNLVLCFAEYPHLKMHLGKAGLLCRMEGNTYRIFLQGLNAIFNLEDERFKFVEFNSLFYDGNLGGRGEFDMAKLPPKINFTMRLRNVNANKLEGMLIHFSKVYGRLFSQMHFSNYPYLGLRGGIYIQKGYLDNLEFFKWLADLFCLPSLRKIDFNRAFSNFSVNAQGAGLHEISLESKDTNLNGYFSIRENDLVSSKLSLGFTKDLMQKSAKFTPLLKLLKKDFAFLNFDFQLSGNLHAMNFQWLESDFKRNIQDLIPNFIQRRLERGVEDIIESISGK